jgi:hypothetical protein
MFSGPNARPPPDQLSRTQLNQVSSWCRYDPVVCLAQVGIEAVFIAVGYSSLLFLTGGNAPGPLDILKFLLVFSVTSIAARMISDDLGNKLSISAVSGIGSKCVSMLAPRFVGW